MKRMTVVALAGLALFMAPGSAGAQVAGSQTIGVTVAEMKEIVTGRSAKKHILGKPIYNEKNDKLGTVDDVIITPDQAVSYEVFTKTTPSDHDSGPHGSYAPL
jgi:PRC-barrel domain